MSFDDIETAKHVCQIIAGNLGTEWGYTEKNGAYFVEIPSIDKGLKGLEQYLTSPTE